MKNGPILSNNIFKKMLNITKIIGICERLLQHLTTQNNGFRFGIEVRIAQGYKVIHLLNVFGVTAEAPDCFLQAAIYL